MKKLTILTVFLLTFFMLAGCQTSRSAISAEEFKTKAEAAGYTVQDASSQYPDGQVDEYWIAVKLSDAIDYQIEFAVVPTAEQAKGAYEQNKADFESKKGNFTVHSTVSIGNYSYYYLTTSARFQVISRVDNTFIYIDAEKEYKDEIENFLQSIGY